MFFSIFAKILWKWKLANESYSIRQWASFVKASKYFGHKSIKKLFSQFYHRLQVKKKFLPIVLFIKLQQRDATRI